MRTKESILNFVTTYIFYFITAILGFVKVKFFLLYLGENVQALNQLYNNLFAYITLLETGMGAAFIYKLYNLLSKKEYDKINSLYSGTVYIFRKIGLFMLGIAFVLSFFLPLFIHDNPFKYWYLLVTFMLFVFKNIIDYFYFVPRYVLTAENKSYKINILMYLFRILIVGVEVLLIYLKLDYIFVLVPAIFLTYLENKVINNKIFKIYPWLKIVDDKNTEIKNDMKHLVFHKIGGLIFNNIDIVLLSSFVGSYSVVVYGAYNYIIKFVTDTSNQISLAVKDGVGSVLSADLSENRKKEIIGETNTIFAFISTLFVTLLFFSLNYFVTIWIGKNYSISIITTILFLILLFHKIISKPSQVYVNTLGLFKETKKYVLYSLLINLILSVCLVSKYGINGVLIGTVVASVLIESWCYSYATAKKLFNKFDIKFWSLPVIKAILIITLEIVIIKLFIIKYLFVPTTLINWVLYCTIISVIILLMSLILYYLLFSNFKTIISKLKHAIVKKSE